MKLTVVLLACICSLSGCTLTGAIIGSVNDNNAPDFDTLMTNELIGFDSEDDVLVVKKDGTTETGKFVAIEKAPAESYAHAYNAFLLQNASSLQLPRFGDSVFAVVSERLIGPFKFKGFDYDGTWLERSDSSSFPFHGSITCSDQTFSPKAGLGDTPLMSSIVMSSDTTRTQIPMELVKHVIVRHPKHGLITGLLVGAAIDAIIVGVFASMSGGWQMQIFPETPD
jgi:hypothetical protein